jgi:hypothetical protein
MASPARESLKSGMVFAVVGVALALTAPPLLAAAAAAMGLAAGGLLGAATVAGVVGSALAFGGFGMLYPRVKSFVGSAFGKQQPDVIGQSAASGLSDRQSNVDSLQAPVRDLQNISGDRTGTTFCQKLDAERAQARATESLSI